MIRFFIEAYRHPTDTIKSNSLSHQNAVTLGSARVRLLVGQDGRVLNREVIESNGHMWRLIGASISKLEFTPRKAAGDGPWNVEVYFSANWPDPTHVPLGKDSKPIIKPDGEIALTILSVTPTKS
jgi:hypothetical protein